MLLVVTILLPFVMAFILFYFRAKLEDPKIEARIGSLYENIRVHSVGPLMYHVVFVIRRLLLAATAVFMPKYTHF